MNLRGIELAIFSVLKKRGQSDGIGSSHKIDQQLTPSKKFAHYTLYNDKADFVYYDDMRHKLLFFKSDDYARELFQGSGFEDVELESTQTLNESLNESEENHDFPLRGDFDSHEDWLHEIKKSPYKYCLVNPSQWYDLEISDIITAYAGLYNPDHLITLESEYSWTTGMYMDQSMVIHDENSKTIKIFLKSPNRVKELKKALYDDMFVRLRLVKTVDLKESYSEYDIPLRSDFDSYQEWIHELKKSPYRQYVEVGAQLSYEDHVTYTVLHNLTMVYDEISTPNEYLIEIDEGYTRGNSYLTYTNEDYDFIYHEEGYGPVKVFFRPGGKMNEFVEYIKDADRTLRVQIMSI